MRPALEIATACHAHLDGKARWHIQLRGDHGHDRAKVIVDGYSGQVLRARLKDSDRDWED